MKKIMRFCIPVLLLFCLGCANKNDTRPLFKTHYLHSMPGEILISTKNDVTIFEVSSEFGIGNAIIEIVKGEWPPRSIIRLYLQGLEGFYVSNSKRRFEKFDLVIQKYDVNGRSFFDVLLPESLLLNESKIKFSWVDFYR